MTDTPPPSPETTEAETSATQQAAAQVAADRHSATRKVYDDISSPYDKPSLNAKERKSYERKVLNIGLVLIMLVIAAIGISAHKLIRGIDDMFDGSVLEFELPETPFSPVPENTVPAPRLQAQPPQPTRMNLPDRALPTADPAKRTVIGRITDISGGIDAANGVLAETVISVRFLVPETGQICSLQITVPPHAAEPQGDTIEVTYNAEVPSEELCASARVFFATE